MISTLFKLTRELWAAVQLSLFLVLALIVFCTVPKNRDELEEDAL